jgi:hypothetical protein
MYAAMWCDERSLKLKFTANLTARRAPPSHDFSPPPRQNPRDSQRGSPPSHDLVAGRRRKSQQLAYSTVARQHFSPNASAVTRAVAVASSRLNLAVAVSSSPLRI